MHGLIRATHRRRQRASTRRHFRHGWRAAAVRAFTGARLYLNKEAPTLVRAAEDCGSNVHYVRAALVVIKDGADLGPVLTGHVPLLTAAKQALRRRKAERITVEEAVVAWRLWSPAQRAEFGRGAGISEIWDDAIIPVMSEERANQQAAE
jgi:hypothetical protein